MENQKNSLVFQHKECLRFAQNNNLPIIDLSEKLFCDHGVIRERHSGYKVKDANLTKDGSYIYKIDRPKFRRMVELLNAKKAAGFICMSTDRLSRNAQDMMVVKALVKMGIDVHYADAKFENNSTGEFSQDMQTSFNNYNSKITSEKIRKANKKLLEEGKRTSRAPIGYIDAGPGNKEIDPERAVIIKRIYELYAAGGWSMTQLAFWANRQGLTTRPQRRMRTVEEILAEEEGDDIRNSLPKVSRPVRKKNIELILKNPFYIGMLDDQNGGWIPGIHKPIINQSLFYQVQEMLKKQCCVVHYPERSFFTYRGFINCTCGRVYSPYVKKGHTYYGSKCIAGCENNSKTLREEKIDDIVVEFLEQIKFTDSEMAEIEERATKELRESHLKRINVLDDLQRQQKRIHEEMHHLENDKLTLIRQNVITPEEYTQRTSDYKKELAVINEQMATFREAEEEMLKTVLTFSELLKNANLYYKNALDVEKQEFALQVFSELVLGDSKVASYKAKEGYETLLKRGTGNYGGR